MGTRLPILQVPRREGRSGQGTATEAVTQCKAASCETKKSQFKYMQGKTTMGRGDGKTELKIQS